MTLGDWSDWLTGRNLLSFSSRDNRTRLFMKQVSGHLPPLTPVGPETLADWRESITRTIVGRQLASLPLLRSENIDVPGRSDAEEQLREDVANFCRRVGEHEHFCTETYDELFSMYVRGRNNVARQWLVLAEKYIPLAPASSFSLLRWAVRIDPVQRATGMLLDRVIRRADFSGLSSVPTADTPFVPQTAPLLLKQCVWAARAFADRKLMGRVLAAKDRRLRQRVVRSIDHAALYGRPETVDRVKSWFSGRFLEPDAFVARAARRARLESRPLIALDIAAAANVSIMLDILHDES